jgi:hypothetical protein
MKADNSRNTFRPDRHYRDVVKQQGRVDVDADWNEQQAINVRRTEVETVDVVGRTGAPLHAPGFAITADGATLRIGAGRYYVDGILCENENGKLDYREQPDRLDHGAVMDELLKVQATSGIVYLDVWLRHVTALNDPLIREIALGGPDTATRTQVVWQVRVLPVAAARLDRDQLVRAQAKQLELQARLTALIASGADLGPTVQELAEVNREIAGLTAAFSTGPLTCDSKVPAWEQLAAPAAGRLNARTSPTPPITDLCQLPPRAGYQRTENQLYRVEVHTGGELGQATFKWSRDNGSVVTTIEDVTGQEVIVHSVGPDDVLGFAAGQWVEISDDDMELRGVPGRLIQIDHVPAGSRNLTMKTTPPVVDAALHPLLRRWDQSGTGAGDAGVAITGDWQALEDGVEVQFSAGPFRTGDYWLIPARTATGDVEWPPFEIPNRNPVAQPPRGIEHHFSRLAVVERSQDVLTITADCRKIFPPLTEISAPPAPPPTPVQRAMHVKGTSWRNDAPLALAEFIERGLFIDLDRVPDAQSVSLKTVVVTLELPIVPDTGFERAPTSREIAPKLSVILFGEVSVNENQIRFLPVRSGLQSLATFFRGLQQAMGRVALHGAALWSLEEGRPLYLDGCAVGVPSRDPADGSSRTDLVFPSGSGERSSDFESWFLLTLPATPGSFVITPPTVRLLQRGNDFIFISSDTGGAVEVVGTITLGSPATAETVITLAAPDNREALSLPASATIPAGATATRFPIGFSRRVPQATESISIVATAAGMDLKAALTLVRP